MAGLAAHCPCRKAVRSQAVRRPVLVQGLPDLRRMGALQALAWRAMQALRQKAARQVGLRQHDSVVQHMDSAIWTAPPAKRLAAQLIAAN